MNLFTLSIILSAVAIGTWRILEKVSQFIQ